VVVVLNKKRRFRGARGASERRVQSVSAQKWREIKHASEKRRVSLLNKKQ